MAFLRIHLKTWNINRTSCLARHVLVRGILVETLVRRSHVCSGICPNSELFRRQKTLAAIAANILLRQPFSLHQSCHVSILYVVLDSYVAFFNAFLSIKFSATCWTESLELGIWECIHEALGSVDSSCRKCLDLEDLGREASPKNLLKWYEE